MPYGFCRGASAADWSRRGNPAADNRRPARSLQSVRKLRPVHLTSIPASVLTFSLIGGTTSLLPPEERPLRGPTTPFAQRTELRQTHAPPAARCSRASACRQTLLHVNTCHRMRSRAIGRSLDQTHTRRAMEASDQTMITRAALRGNPCAMEVPSRRGPQKRAHPYRHDARSPQISQTGAATLTTPPEAMGTSAKFSHESGNPVVRDDEGHRPSNSFLVVRSAFPAERSPSYRCLGRADLAVLLGLFAFSAAVLALRAPRCVLQDLR